MTTLLTEAFRKAQSLPEHLQNELAEQLTQDIESELSWQQALSQPQTSRLDELATQPLEASQQGKTHFLGFDDL